MQGLWADRFSEECLQCFEFAENSSAASVIMGNHNVRRLHWVKQTSLLQVSSRSKSQQYRVQQLQGDKGHFVAETYNKQADTENILNPKFLTNNK